MKWWVKQKAPHKKDQKSFPKSNERRKFVKKLRESLSEDLIRYIRITTFLLVYITLNWLILKFNLKIDLNLANIAIFSGIVKDFFFSK